MNTKLILIISIFISFQLLCNGKSKEGNKHILNNTNWNDTDNNPILAHDGGISQFNGVYYWYGCDYSGNPTGKYGLDAYVNKVNNGTNVYTSVDLKNWKFEGVALDKPENLKGIIGKGSIHRPHVIFCKKTGKYVLWFFYFKDVYPDVMASVAVSDSPKGPFTFIGTVETGSTAITGAKTESNEQKSEAPAGCSQDLNIFVDKDNTAYLVYDDGIRNIRVDKLSDDYLSSTKQTVIALPAGNERHEAPAMVKFKGKYIVAGSGVVGWGPSATYYAIADNPMGPYSAKKLLTPKNNLNTWNSQITSFVYVSQSDRLITMCNQWWIPDIYDVNKSRYLWLEVISHKNPNEFEMVYSDKLNIDIKKRNIK